MPIDDTHTTIHIAGLALSVYTHLRQRCGWCGAVLVDVDVSTIAVPADRDGEYPTWQPGCLVGVDRDEVGGSGAMWHVDHDEGDQPPANCCAALDPAATL